MDGRLKGNCGRSEGGSGKGSKLIPKFIMAEDDKATAVTREGMLNGEGCIAAIAGSREVGGVESVSEFQGGEDGMGCDGWSNREPGACGLGAFQDARVWKA